MTPEAARAFVVEHTVRRPVPLVPELSVRVASEVTPLWHATEAWLDARGVPPPFWAFAWAGGQALARFVLDAPTLVRGRRVVDLATGGGLVALAAARAGAARVVALDLDPLAVAATALAAEESGLAVEPLQADAEGVDLARFDVVLAGDVFYERTQARLFTTLLRRAAAQGAAVLAGDPGRAYAPVEGFVVRATYDVPTPEELEGTSTKRARVLEAARTAQ